MGFEINPEIISKMNEVYKAHKSDAVQENAKAPIDMTEGADAKPKAKPQRQWDYELGPREGNTRIITPDSVATVSNGASAISSSGVGLNGHLQALRNQQALYSTADGHIGSSQQARYRGDCYFLAEINAIRNLDNGQKILGECVKSNPNGSYTVTLPGAVKIRQHYAAKNLRCEVTGTYHISAETVAKAVKNAGLTYSKGEIEVIVLELAMESYRAEMVKTNQLNGNRQNGPQTAESSVQGAQNRRNNDYLSSGYSYDAAFLLTGKKSDVYKAKPEKMRNLQRYQDGKYGYISREEMARRTGADISMYNEKGISQVSSTTSSEAGLRGMLNKYQGHENEYALTCYVQVQKGDEATPNDGYHALTVVKITADTVYCANPWHPDKIEPIPRRDFEKMVYGFEAVDLRNAGSRPQLSANNQSVQAILGRLTHHMNNNQSHQTIRPSKINELLHSLNSSGRRQNASRQLNFEDFTRIFNNVSKAELDDAQKEKLEQLFSSLSFPESVSEEDVAIMRYFEEYFGK
ncbi:hypothetical protein J6A64_03130 [bacterium]|nr:hypothetical protein [bacterium]